MRGIIYFLGRILGDANAARKSKVGRRIGRRVAGRATGKLFKRIFG